MVDSRPTVVNAPFIGEALLSTMSATVEESMALLKGEVGAASANTVVDDAESESSVEAIVAT